MDSALAQTSPHTAQPLRLETFGGLRLVGAQAGSAHQRKRLALLAVLAASGDRGVSRDVLYAYFWPETSADAARHSLEQLLYALRRSLGESLFSGTNPLLLNPEIITSDWADFERATTRGLLPDAVGLYRGPFLDGFYISDAPEFERWAESERARLAERYKAALVTLAEGADAALVHASAIRWWRMLAVADPLSGRVSCGLMRALAAAGDLAAALREAYRHETVVQQELGSAPDPAVTALARELRAGAAAERAMPAVSTTPPPQSLGSHEAVAAGSIDAQIEPSAVVRSVPRRWTRGRWLLVVGVSLAATLLLATSTRDRSAGAARRSNGSETSGANLPTIAVLPFTSHGGDPESEHFADAMTDELITQLAKTGVLRVTARTSAFAFKGHNTDVRAIADSLGVANVLEGSVQRVGSRIRLRVRLANAVEGASRWSDSYDRELEDVFAVQDDIARAVVGALRAELGRDVEPRLVRVARTNLAAYELYLRGKQEWYVRSDSALRLAIDYFNRAIALDSAYAAAYAGVAGAYTLIGTGNYGDYNAREDYRKALTAARKAISLDDSLADGHSVLGFIKTVFERDWTGAEAEFARASELDPTYSQAHLQRSTLFTWLGRNDEAIASARRSQATDPFSAVASAELARALFFARRYDDALAELARTHAIDSGFPRLFLTRGEIYVKKNMLTEAIADLRRAAMVSSRPPRANSLLAYALATAGQRDEALRILSELQGRWRAGRIGAFDIAVAYAGLRDYDQAFAWLDRSYDDRSIRPFIMDPIFDDLRADPRFARLRRKLRLP